VKRAIEKHLRHFIALFVIALIAIGVAGYILSQVRFNPPAWVPLFGKDFYHLKVELETAQAVVPGQGQTVNIAGVKVGDIGKVELDNGHAVVEMKIQRKYAPIYRNATILLRPKTGLKDMFLELDPGTQSAGEVPENDEIPVSNTVPDVNPDEILAMLDSDTRDYLTLLVTGAGRGLKGRGEDLRETYRLFEPTHRDIARVNSAVATRKRNLRRLVSALEELSTELAGKDRDLSELVQGASRVFRAYASEDRNISAAVHELPAALDQATDTLGKVQRLAEVLGPASEELRPAVRALGRSQEALRPLAQEHTPTVERRIRPFVRELRPLVRDLRPASADLSATAPDLTRTLSVVNRFFNMAAYNPDGREDPGKRERQEGFLFWLAWLPHQSANIFSTADAHGPLRPSLVAGSCQTLRTMAKDRPETEFALNLTPILTNPELCGD
jgi:phospholipid/cholesterol/gamma-HCH transport system substrate-binding protein